MVTCFLKYVIDPYKLDEFESYARAWIPIVNRMGGSHHGYYLPHEGANNLAYALFSFPRLAAYDGLAPIFPYTFYHLTHHWFAAADIPVVNDIPVHYADAILYNVRRPPQGSLPLLTRRASA